MKQVLRALVGSFAMTMAVAAFAETPALDCKIGPVTKDYGNSSWLVYGCNDSHSVVLMSAPGSKAFPFYFMFHWENGTHRLIGEGTGNKIATEAAFQNLRSMKDEDILKLFGEAKSANHPG